jgi:signal transduction histidine kinase
MIKILILAIVAAEIILAVFVWLKNKRDPRNISFAGFSLCMALWSLSLYVMWNTHDIYLLNVWAKLCYVGPIFAPLFILYFVKTFPEKDKLKLDQQLKSGLFIAALLIVLNQLGLITSDYKTAITYVNHPLYYLLFSPYFVVFLGSVFVVLLSKLKTLQGVNKSQARFVLYGLVLASAIGCSFSLFLPMFGYANFNYLGPLLGGPCFVFFIAYAIIRYQFMDIRITITKTGIFLSLYTAVLGIPFLIGYYYSWIFAIVIMFCLASLGPLIYAALEQKAVDIILKRENHYRKILLDISKGINEIEDLNRLLKLIVYVIKKVIGIHFVAVFVADEKTSSYKMEVARNKSSLYFSSYYFSKDHPLISHIEEMNAPFTADRLPQDLFFSLTFTSAKINLIVPTYIEKKLIGFIVLGEKRDLTSYSPEDIHIFEILSRQIALAIINFRFLDEFKMTNERIFAAEKLASIGGMASGIIHQIGNRLAQFTLAVKQQKTAATRLLALAPANPDLKQGIDALSQYSSIIEQNVTSLGEITYGILNFTRARIEKGSNMSAPFSLRELIALTVAPLRVKHCINDAFPLEVEIADYDIIYGIRSQVMEALLNIFDNAYESTEEKYNSIQTPEERLKYIPKIRIKLELSPTVSRIVINDNGMGVSEDAAKKMFTPFFTTKSNSKKSGTGIGMYVVKRMIEENMRGKIWFSSKKIEGTTFYIELPAKPA